MLETASSAGTGPRRANSQGTKLSKDDTKGVKCLVEDTTYGRPYGTGDVVRTCDAG